MNPNLWISWFYALPAWPCPHCGLGTLHLDGEITHKIPEGILENLEPDELNGPFSAWMRCSNQDCRAHVAVQVLQVRIFQVKRMPRGGAARP